MKNSTEAYFRQQLIRYSQKHGVLKASGVNASHILAFCVIKCYTHS